MVADLKASCNKEGLTLAIFLKGKMVNLNTMVVDLNASWNKEGSTLAIFLKGKMANLNTTQKVILQSQPWRQQSAN